MMIRVMLVILIMIKMVTAGDIDHDDDADHYEDNSEAADVDHDGDNGDDNRNFVFAN